MVASRADLAAVLRRDELTQPGVYVLVGTTDSGAQRLYVGEADVLGERLRSHAARKDFWTSFVAFAATDESLNKAHIRYLESRLITLARKARQWEVENNTSPTEPPLSEADRADADWFLAEMLLIYPILGIDAFEAADARQPGVAVQDLLFLNERGAVGRGRETADGFVILEGSRARAAEVPSIHAYLVELRQQLQDRGVLVANRDHLIFTQDFRFNSPSTAAGVLVGGSANGRRAWKDETGRTLKQRQSVPSPPSH